MLLQTCKTIDTKDYVASDGLHVVLQIYWTSRTRIQFGRRG